MLIHMCVPGKAFIAVVACTLAPQLPKFIHMCVTGAAFIAASGLHASDEYAYTGAVAADEKHHRRLWSMSQL